MTEFQAPGVYFTQAGPQNTASTLELVRTDEPVIAAAGTGRGADTAAILKPSNAQAFFDLRFLEIICMPAPGHP